MMFQNTCFMISCYDLATLPDDFGAEMIFLGRSNVDRVPL